MSSPFNFAIEALSGVVETYAGESITVSRTGETDITIDSVLIGETRVEEELEDNTVLSVRIRDFILATDDYAFGSPAVVSDPQPGDEITCTINGASVKFQVLPLAGERSFQKHDREGKKIRIHGKEIA